MRRGAAAVRQLDRIGHRPEAEPFVCDPWDYYREIIAWIRRKHAEGFTEPDALDHLVVARSVTEAVDLGERAVWRARCLGDPRQAPIRRRRPTDR